jgi:hypothetical protein
MQDEHAQGRRSHVLDRPTEHPYLSSARFVPNGDRQEVRVRRLRDRVGIITVAATRWSPRRAVVVAVFAPERRGGTNEIAVSDTAVHTNRSAGRALNEEERRR